MRVDDEAGNGLNLGCLTGMSHSATRRTSSKAVRRNGTRCDPSPTWRYRRCFELKAELESGSSC